MHNMRLLRGDSGESGGLSRDNANEGTLEPRVARADTGAEHLARTLIRMIWVCTATWVVLPVAKAVELACMLGVGDPLAAAAKSEDGTLITRVAEWSGVLASAVSPVATFAVGALVALALASLAIEVRSITPRVGATIAALALYGGPAVQAAEIREGLLALAPGLRGIAVAITIGVASLVLAWRWVENVALAAALPAREDPLAVSAEVDREAGSRAHRGVDSVNTSASRLAGAFHRVVGEPVSEEDAGLSGRGSPIPRRVPDDEPLSVRSA